MFSSSLRTVINPASFGDHPASFDKQKLFNSRGEQVLLNSTSFKDQPMFFSRPQIVMNPATSGDQSVYGSGTQVDKNPASLVDQPMFSSRTQAVMKPTSFEDQPRTCAYRA